jgi:hypothetical protein
MGKSLCSVVKVEYQFTTFGVFSLPLIFLFNNYHDLSFVMGSLKLYYKIHTESKVIPVTGHGGP